MLYRKKHNLSKKTKIFICKGYHTFKKALLERGWHENTDFHSSIFHLKFTVKRDSLFKLSPQQKLLHYYEQGNQQ